MGAATALLLLLLLLLLATLLSSIYDARQQAREWRLSQSLQQANAQRQEANGQRRRLAFQDALTGLPNRLQFEQALQQAAQDMAGGSHWPGPRLAVLFSDLDGF